MNQQVIIIAGIAVLAILFIMVMSARLYEKKQGRMKP